MSLHRVAFAIAIAVAGMMILSSALAVIATPTNVASGARTVAVAVDSAPVPATGPVHPDVSAYAIIYPNCTTTPTPPFAQAGDVFTLTGDYTGAIVDSCAGSQLNGAGYTVDAAGLPFGVQINTTSDVTITDLSVRGDPTFGVAIQNSTDATVDRVTTGAGSFYGIYATSDRTVDLSDVQANNSVEYGVYLLAVAGATINDTNASLGGFGYWLAASSNVTVSSSSGAFEGTGAELPADSNLRLIDDNFSFDSNQGVYAWLSHGISLENVSAVLSGIGVELVEDDDTAIAASNVSRADSYGLEALSCSGLTVQDTSVGHAGNDGVYASGGSALSITDVVANDSANFGFDFENTSSVTIANSYASSDVFAGLRVVASSDVASSNNEFDHATNPTGNGTFLYDDVDVAVAGDTDSFDLVGVDDIGSTGLTVSAVNSSGDYEGFSFVNDRTVDVSGSTAYQDARGFDFVGTNGGSGTGLRVVNASVAAYLLEYATDVAIADSTALLAEIAYDDFFSYGTPLFNVSFTNVEVGLDINTVFNSTFDDVFVHNATVAAVGEFDAAGLLVEASNFSDSAIGFELSDVYNDSFIGNTFDRDASDFDLDLPEMLSVSIYWNNFIEGGGWSVVVGDGGNGSVAFADGYPAGGNYWSNWTSPDAMSGPLQNLPGSDGIVDVPLEIQGPVDDPYPLTTPVSLDDLNVEFIALGLPTGQAWAVTFNGSTQSTTSDALTFATNVAANGVSFGYSVLAPPGSCATVNSTGTIVTDRQGQVVFVTFSPVTYNVTFRESGLAAGTRWSVSIDGTSYSSTSSSISVFLANGTYNFTVEPMAGFVVAPLNGTALVSDTGATVNVVFAPVVFLVSFTEHGLPVGTSWRVTFDGIPAASTAATITFSVPNGTYAYTVANVSGYTPVGGSGTQLVAGPGASITVAFAGVTSSSGLFGSWLTWALLALVVILAVALVAALLTRRRSKPSETPSAWTPPPAAAPVAGPATPPPPPTGGGTPPSPGAPGETPPWKE
jgi:Right handed beta helix region